MTDGLAALERRVRKLEDIQEIIALKSRYLSAANGGWSANPVASNVEEVVPLFAEDGTWYSDSQGLITGREAIRKVWSSFSRTMPFQLVTVSNPLIVVDGDHATGEWYLMGLMTDAKGNELWSAGVYEDKYKRTPEGWRIACIRAKLIFLGPYGEGWEKLVAAANQRISGEKAQGWPEMRERDTSNIR